MNEIIIPGMVGGLRKGSHNRMAYKAAREPMPEGAPLNRHEPRDIPIIDQDGRPTNEAPPAAHRKRPEAPNQRIRINRAGRDLAG